MTALIIIYTCLSIVEFYFFGMQRVLLETGRILEKNIDFLLPNWFVIHHIPIVLKYAAIIWICTLNFWIGLLVFVAGFIIFNVFLPIPRKIYRKIFNKQMYSKGLDNSEIIDISLALSRVMQ
jgi:hypothetical protein